MIQYSQRACGSLEGTLEDNYSIHYKLSNSLDCGKICSNIQNLVTKLSKKEDIDWNNYILSINIKEISHNIDPFAPKPLCIENLSGI